MVWDFRRESTSVCAGRQADGRPAFRVIAEALERSTSRLHWEARQADATMQLRRRLRSSPLTRRITTTLATPTFPTSSTSGCAALCATVHPDLLSTLLVPKAEELVANPYRHGGTEGAKDFFEDGFDVCSRMRVSTRSGDYPITVYYAFKQSETDEDGTASTGWETLLDGMIRSGWAITATWPMRTELGGRMIAASAPMPLPPRSSSRCVRVQMMRRRPTAAASSPRCSANLPEPARAATGRIAPVDLPQAAIGPGMAVFSRYAQGH